MENQTLDLSQCAGSERLHRVSRRFLITEGCKYLADKAACYWLIDAASSHIAEIGTSDWFVLVRLVVKDSRAVLTYEDGNGNTYAKQEIEYTDFPLKEIKLYACWDGTHWVLMLPSEY